MCSRQIQCANKSRKGFGAHDFHHSLSDLSIHQHERWMQYINIPATTNIGSQKASKLNYFLYLCVVMWTWQPIYIRLFIQEFSFQVRFFSITRILLEHCNILKYIVFFHVQVNFSTTLNYLGKLKSMQNFNSKEWKFCIVSQIWKEWKFSKECKFCIVSQSLWN